MAANRLAVACGMCPSCLQRDYCPGYLRIGPGKPGCSNYLPPEPTRREWPGIFRDALRKLKEPCDQCTHVYRIGRVNAIRDAMRRIHGFSAEEIRKIEDEAGR